ncbi:sulfotransferase [Dasania sp. GY-MA-18]|uniref:Sulfotransferase n=1 Tax=Dasania phycosphaerae TaxID=2950436 RepID=A0A9J6RPT9_9GAMM|nr:MULTISPECIES: tetratricopeptide repeat-containing sulfotransferase family protein [Dasania]MCR8923611.1 sulfotransferase [Dasania sp. GY-MA-18]MCZ0866045.1 sulfotransferase [Dasania phycosphaerae]MCZ0869769.1 sulfotransferase [Dasania phycosphaerae]
MATPPSIQPLLAQINKGMFREAAANLQQLLTQFPQQASFWHLYSVVAIKLHQAAKAIEFAQQALHYSPNNIAYRVQLAAALQQNVQITEALAEAAAIENDPKLQTEADPAVWDALATVYTHCGNLERAQYWYEQAVAAAPDSLHFQFNLATAYRGNGQFDKAEAIYDAVIAKNPQDYEAYANRSQLRKQTPDANHISEMAGLLAQGIAEWREESRICYALAKECEDVARYEQSFSYLKRGADLRRQHMSYQVSSDVEAMDKIIATFSAELVQQTRASCDSAEPIFIIGLPRTGTTLAERIVDSHSEVRSAGELQNFASQMIKQVMAQFPGQQLSKLALIEKSTELDFAALGQSYIDSTRPMTGQHAHFIDKLPLNYLYLGLIKMALPNAKIIHLTRHPMDACYAIYKTLFAQAYPFSYDLNDLGDYYLAYHRLMQHWHKVFPGQIYDLSYEDLVHNPEQQSKALIDYCGLQWQPQCLNFHHNPSASMTASAAQVRQPIHTGSVQKWRHYEAQLQPLLDKLARVLPSADV